MEPFSWILNRSWENKVPPKYGVRDKKGFHKSSFGSIFGIIPSLSVSHHEKQSDTSHVWPIANPRVVTPSGVVTGARGACPGFGGVKRKEEIDLENVRKGEKIRWPHPNPTRKALLCRLPFHLVRPLPAPTLGCQCPSYGSTHATPSVMQPSYHPPHIKRWNVLHFIFNFWSSWLGDSRRYSWYF